MTLFLGVSRRHDKRVSAGEKLHEHQLLLKEGRMGIKTCKISYITTAFQVNLGFKRQSVKTVEEKPPAEDLLTG